MSEKLKNCPFCNNRALGSGRNNPYCQQGGLQTNGPDWATIACDKCWYMFCENDAPDGQRGMLERKRWMFAKWNTRPIEDALRREVEELKAKLEATYSVIEEEEGVSYLGWLKSTAEKIAKE